MVTADIMEKNNIIELVDAVKVYKGGVSALDRVSFTVEPGEFVFVVGESGAGKSTLFKLLTCEERANAGKVMLDDYDLSAMPRRLVPFLRRKVGMIFQDFRLIKGKTVYENVAFAMEIIGTSPDKIKRRVPLVLSQVGLRHKIKRYPDELSGGEAQRLGIARAIVNSPRLILADEPTGNLDPHNGEAIMALLDCINQDGTTIIACTHDKNLVDRMKKRVLEFDNGKLIGDARHSGYSPSLSCVRPEDKSLPAADFSWSASDYNYDLEQELLRHKRTDFAKIPEVDDMQKTIEESHERRLIRRRQRND